MRTVVISLGGSIVAPDGVDVEFLKKFKTSIDLFLKENSDVRIIFVVGGGAPARNYQNSIKNMLGKVSADNLDWIGIRATHLNAEIIRCLFDVKDNLVVNPSDDNITFTGRVLVAGGWKPGFSTDTDSVYLAKRFNANMVINLSNTKGVYTSDPRKDKNAKFVEKISWKDFIDIVGKTWDPGLNVPFDPIASDFANKNGISVVCADGKDIDNTISILKNSTFIGTLIS